MEAPWWYGARNSRIAAGTGGGLEVRRITGSRDASAGVDCMDDTAQEWLVETELVTVRHLFDAPVCKEACERLVAKERLQLDTSAIDSALGFVDCDGRTITTCPLTVEMSCDLVGRVL